MLTYGFTIPFCFWLLKSTRIVICFEDHCLSFCHFSFGHCVVCSFSIYGFWLPLWYPETLPTESGIQVGSIRCHYKIEQDLIHQTDINWFVESDIEATIVNSAVTKRYYQKRFYLVVNLNMFLHFRIISLERESQFKIHKFPLWKKFIVQIASHSVWLNLKTSRTWYSLDFLSCWSPINFNFDNVL